MAASQGSGKREDTRPVPADALAEIVGCYLPWLWLRKGGSIWLLLPPARQPGAVRLAADPAPDRQWAGLCRHGGVYIGTALFWLWLVDGIRPSRWDLFGAALPGRHGSDHVRSAHLIGVGRAMLGRSSSHCAGARKPSMARCCKGSDGA